VRPHRAAHTAVRKGSAQLEGRERAPTQDVTESVEREHGITSDLAGCEVSYCQGGRNRCRCPAGKLEAMRNAQASLEQRERIGERDRDDGVDLVGMQPVRGQRQVGADGEDALHLVVGAAGPAREAATEGGEIVRHDPEPDLLVCFAYGLREGLSCPQVPANGDIECPRPRVLRTGSALEERELSPCLVDTTDPDVKGAVPVAVAVDSASLLDLAGRRAVLVQDVEELVLRVGGDRGVAQNRSSTPSSAPSATSCSVSSLRPGRTSRCSTPSPSSRYWPTQSSRGE